MRDYWYPTPGAATHTVGKGISSQTKTRIHFNRSHLPPAWGRQQQCRQMVRCLIMTRRAALSDPLAL